MNYEKNINLLNIFTVLFISICFSSCVSISKGYVTPSFDYQPDNFHYIKSVSGSHAESYFLGIGGDLHGMGLNNTALTNLKNNANLKSNQCLINVSYDNKSSFYFLGIMVK
ncbi:MAG: hypothetical protein HN427_05735 [Flavobacteriales bacterium]|jgi:hypothetical protein|nr:hypothetical protein [Flavobacteriales bacterium]MBT6013418.1 hypothetical protein [Flavobacteriales bacterium]MBT7481440.1 hypothetical protein [Flavobacteriales bacterium]